MVQRYDLCGWVWPSMSMLSARQGSARQGSARQVWVIDHENPNVYKKGIGVDVVGDGSILR